MSENSKTVLIVEDDSHISKVYEIQIKREGFNTTIARDGEQAIEFLKTENFDLIILDLMIPKKDGFSVLEEIRKNPKFLNIPVLIISNLGQKADEIRAIELGATEYLIKIDHSIQEVINKVKSYLEK